MFQSRGKKMRNSIQATAAPEVVVDDRPDALVDLGHRSRKHENVLIASSATVSLSEAQGARNLFSESFMDASLEPDRSDERFERRALLADERGGSRQLEEPRVRAA